MTKSSRSKSYSVGEYHDNTSDSSTRDANLDPFSCSIALDRAESEIPRTARREKRRSHSPDAISLEALTRRPRCTLEDEDPIEGGTTPITETWLLSGEQSDLSHSRRSIDPLLLNQDDNIPFLIHPHHRHNIRRLRGGAASSPSSSRDNLSPVSKRSRLNSIASQIGKNVEHVS
jgi:hypothetical protein